MIYIKETQKILKKKMFAFDIFNVWFQIANSLTILLKSQVVVLKKILRVIHHLYSEDPDRNLTFLREKKFQNHENK